MARLRSLDLLAVGLVAAVSLVDVLLWGRLPTHLAIHWSGNTPDRLTATPSGADTSILFRGVVFA